MQRPGASQFGWSNPIASVEWERDYLAAVVQDVGNLTDERVLRASQHLDGLILTLYRAGLVS